MLVVLLDYMCDEVDYRHLYIIIEKFNRLMWRIIDDNTNYGI